MSIYYISIPAENAGLVSKEVDNSGTNVEVLESSAISGLKVSRDESLAHEVSQIKDILLDETKSTEEKSDAYEALKELNANKGREESLEKLLNKNFNYETFVKIDGSNIKVVVNSKEHSYELANKIINVVQKEFTENVYVTVSFGAV